MLKKTPPKTKKTKTNQPKPPDFYMIGFLPFVNKLFNQRDTWCTKTFLSAQSKSWSKITSILNTLYKHFYYPRDVRSLQVFNTKMNTIFVLKSQSSLALKEAFISDFSLQPPQSRDSLFSISLHFSYKRKKGQRNNLPIPDSNMQQDHTIPKSENPVQKLDLIAEGDDEAIEASELRDNKEPTKTSPPPGKTTVHGNRTFHHIPTSVRAPGSKHKLPPCSSLMAPVVPITPNNQLDSQIPLQFITSHGSSSLSDLLKQKLLWLWRLLRTRRPQPAAMLP